MPEPAPPRALTTAELRADKLSRTTFRALRRRPVTVLLDGVRQGYNVGALFRLCDAMLAEKLVVCGRSAEAGRRRIVQAAAGTHRWVPQEWRPEPTAPLRALRAAGYWIVAVEQAREAVPPERLQPRFPVCLILGAERRGVSEAALALADEAVAIPMAGMANSLNVATAAAIALHHVVLSWERCVQTNQGEVGNEH